MLELINMTRSETDGVEKTAKVYHDTENLGYIVKFYIGLTHLHESDYYTDEKKDAIGTASAFVDKTRTRSEAQLQ